MVQTRPPVSPVGWLVPATAAIIALGGPSASVSRLLEPCTVSLGARTEVDVRLVREHVGDDAASVVLRYWRHARRFFERIHHAPIGAGPYLTVRHQLFSAKQTSTSKNRRDLTVEYESLLQIPGVGPFVEEMLSAEPSRKTLRTLGSPFAANVRTQTTSRGHEYLRATLTVDVSSLMPWPSALGGAVGWEEVTRRVIVDAFHADWRDRAVRRLASVTVESDEVWPDVYAEARSS